ncbi:MAG: response regulator [Burkholderiales bacterium]|nr:response regulator [Burkholderiales bacterium]
MGYSEAADGTQALAVVQSDSPDFITMDVNMPGMNGFETVEKNSPGQPARQNRNPDCQHPGKQPRTGAAAGRAVCTKPPPGCNPAGGGPFSGRVMKLSALELDALTEILTMVWAGGPVPQRVGA